VGPDSELYAIQNCNFGFGYPSIVNPPGSLNDPLDPGPAWLLSRADTLALPHGHRSLASDVCREQWSVVRTVSRVGCRECFLVRWFECIQR
jgi:hypothetical protein